MAKTVGFVGGGSKPGAGGESQNRGRVSDQLGRAGWSLHPSALLRYYIPAMAEITSAFAGWFAIYGWGAWWSSLVGPRCDFWFRSMIGLAWTSWLLSVSAVCGLYRLETVVVVITFGGVWAGVDVFRRRRHLRAARGDVAAAIGLLLVSLISVGWAWWLPETFYDALYYHLGMSAHALRWSEWPLSDNVVHSAFPAGIGVLFGAIDGLGGDVGAKLFGAAFPLLSAGIVHRVLREAQVDRGSAWVMALVFASTPGLIVMSTVVSVDPALCFCGAAVLLGLSRIRSTGPEPRLDGWLLVGFALGMGASGKYTGLYLVAGVMAVLAIRVVALPTSRHRLHAALALMLPAFVVPAPWYLRNMLRFGNPVYPAFSAPDGAAGYALERLARDLPHFELPAQTGELVWRLWVQGDLGAGGRMGWVMPLALLGCIFAVRVRSFREPLAVVGVFFVLWASQAQGARYIYPILPWVVALAGLALSHSALNRVGRIAVLGMMVALAIPGWWSAHRTTRAIHAPSAFAYLSGDVGREDYLAERLPQYPAFQWLNENTPSEARVLLIGETRIYHIHRRAEFSSAYDRNRFARWVRSSSSTAELLHKLNGFDFVLINRAELGRLRRAYDYLDLAPAEMDRVKAWLATCELRYSDQGVQICALRGTT